MRYWAIRLFLVFCWGGVTSLTICDYSVYAEDKLKLEPIQLYRINPTQSVVFQTNNGSHMLLQLQNDSNRNIATVKVQCGEFLKTVKLSPYAPQSVLRWDRNWRGCQLWVKNLTEKITPATVVVFIVGQ